MSGTQLINLKEVKPGMLIIHQGKTWRASVNKGDKLYIHTLHEAKPIKDLTVEVITDKYSDEINLATERENEQISWDEFRGNYT